MPPTRNHETSRHAACVQKIEDFLQYLRPHHHERVPHLTTVLIFPLPLWLRFKVVGIATRFLLAFSLSPTGIRHWGGVYYERELTLNELTLTNAQCLCLWERVSSYLSSIGLFMRHSGDLITWIGSEYYNKIFK